MNYGNEENLEMLNSVINSKEKNLVSHSCAVMTFSVSWAVKTREF